MKIDIDKLIDKLPLRDAMEIEDRTGQTVPDLFRGQASAKALTALVWIVKRAHEDPAFTWDQALDVELGALDDLDKYVATDDGDDGDGDPTEAASSDDGESVST